MELREDKENERDEEGEPCPRGQTVPSQAADATRKGAAAAGGRQAEDLRLGQSFQNRLEVTGVQCSHASGAINGIDSHRPTLS